jgi:hypothetical protein
MRSPFVTLSALAALIFVACSHPDRRGRVDGRAYSYSDEGGLTVKTLGVRGEQQTSQRWVFTAEALADQVILDPPAPVVPKPTPPGQPTGHRHEGVDVITSASVTASNAPLRTEKWRFQGIGGATWLRPSDRAPGELSALVRGSSENDYKSLYGRFGGSVDLFQRNFSVSAFVGGGRDWLFPTEVPPGQTALWPSSHTRLNAGVLVNQLITPTLTLNAGLGFTHQQGTLSSAYRRATVQSTLFPEVLPDRRERLTGFFGGSWFIGGGTALHFRQGFYADSWGVLSLIPEASVVKEIGSHLVASFRYRHYAQKAASFYEPNYATLSRYMTGDPRLGVLHDNVGGLEVRYTPWGRLGWSNSLTFIAGYDLSLLRYDLLRGTSRSQVFSLGVTWLH